MRSEAEVPLTPRRKTMAGGRSNVARSLREEVEDLKDEDTMKHAQKGLENWRDTEDAKRRDKKKMEGLKNAEFSKRLQTGLGDYKPRMKVEKKRNGRYEEGCVGGVGEEC
jgi:hypothetical protein